MESKLRIAGAISESIVDGPGIRYVLFLQGCPHHCKGCHNPTALPFDDGTEVFVNEVLQSIEKNPLLDGVTFSGGEPFVQAKNLVFLAQEIKKKGLELAIYTGYTFEELLKLSEQAPEILLLLSLCDTLIDGKFVEEQKSLALRFRGSKNQRILNVPQSLRQQKAVLETASRWTGV